MSQPNHSIPADSPSLNMWSLIAWSAVAVLTFHLAYEFHPLAFLMAIFLYALFELARVRSTRLAFWTGLTIGLALYAPHLAFFWGIFRYSAIAMWLILALGLGIFLSLARASCSTFPRLSFLAALPIFWTGIEYFRSELFHLRFSWLSLGYAFNNSAMIPWFGMYGVAFVLGCAASALFLLQPRKRLFTGAILLSAIGVICNWRPVPPPPAASGPMVVGIQLEEPSQRRIITALETAIGRRPAAELLVLSEYTLASPPPEALLDWCRGNHRYLIVGGMRYLAGNGNAFRDTAFVIGPEGTVVFEQAKSVPIQFMNDGLPADQQSLWDSPWGKIGLCICYDLSYTRVTDRLITMGAQAIIVPTMDLSTWGAHEHWLHSLVAPTRAAEYGIPIVRVASSGISQIVSADGTVLASASFPGQGAEIFQRLPIRNAGGRLPLDRYGAPLCSFISALLVLMLAVLTGARWWKRRR